MWVESEREEQVILHFVHVAYYLLGTVQRSPSAELLPGGGELPGHPTAPWGHHVPPGAALRRADEEAVEPPELQGPCVASRDAAGRGVVQQEDLPDHQARSDSPLCVCVCVWIFYGGW
jgi:hypothetical protein